MDLVYVGITVLFFAARRGLCRRLRSAEWRRVMTIDHIVGLIVTLGLLVYLTYALLKPEKF